MTEVSVIELLKQYPVCKRYLDSKAYAKEYFDPYDRQKNDEKEQYEARMNAIESLVHLLNPSDEYTLLRLHYINDISIEKCAESMGISVRTAWRRLNKAHILLSDFVNKKGGD